MAKQATGKRSDIMQDLTDRFIKALESGEANPRGWVRPWHKLNSVTFARNVDTGKAYKGINQLWFSMIADDAGEPAIFGTYRQWQAAGCSVRKGEKSYPGVKWVEGKLTAEELAAKARGEKVRRPSLFPVGFAVFHFGQVESITEPYKVKVYDAAGEFEWVEKPAPEGDPKAKVKARFVPKPVELTPHERTEQLQLAENTLRATGITIKVGGDRAFYKRSSDEVHVPKPEQFFDLNSWLSTLAHEETHATGAEHRLNRPASGRFGDEKYAEEELCAELGSAALCRHLNITPTVWTNHDDYLANWIEVLRNDKWALNRAASAADKAVTWLLEAAGFTVEPDPAEEADKPADGPVEAVVADPPKPKRTRRPKAAATA